MSRKKIGAIIFVVICALFAYVKQELLFTNPFEEIVFENVVYVTKDAQDNLLVLDSSGQRLLKVDASNVLQWEVLSSGGGFDEAKRVISNDEGHIFVQDVTKEEDGFRISGERILEYSVSGEFLGIVAEYEYEEAVLTPHIGGIFPGGDGMCYIYKLEDSFEIYDEEGSLVRSCFMEGAGQYIASFALDQDTNNIYYSTYSGHVCRYVDGMQDVILYDAADSGGLSVPKEISMDLEQRLYIADIGLRDVLMVDENGTVERIIENLDLYDKEIAYYLNADHGLVVCTDYSVKLLMDGEYEYVTSCRASGIRIFICILLWIAVAVLSAAVLYLVYHIFRYIIRSGSWFAKIVTIMILGITGVSGIFIAILFPQFQEQVLDAVFTRAQMAAEITAEKLPAGEFTRLDSADDFMGEDYIAVRNAVNDIFLTGNESIYDLYCTLYRIQDDMIVSTYCLQEDTGAFYPYDWSYEGSDEQEIIETKEGKTYSSQTSEGSYLFVLSPIMDDDGEVIGLIEVGTDLSSFERENREIFFQLLLNMVAMMVVIILVAIEVLEFYQAKTEYKKQRLSNCDNDTIVPVPTDILRMIVFTIFFLTNMATGFLPIYAMNLSERGMTFGSPAQVLAAIPISAEVVTGAVFSAFGNNVIKKLGERQAVIVSALLFTAGFALRIVPNIWVLTLGNGVIGVGWGVLLLMVNTMIAKKPEEEKDKGFAAYSAAAQNGVNCGVVFGGFLINWFSYQWIFVFATVISLAVFRLVSKYLSFGSDRTNEEHKSGNGEMSTVRFLLKGKVLSYFIMIVIPIIACGYFLNYMFPILASEYGMSETNISYSYLLNGLCIMCFSSLLTSFFSKRNKKAPALVLSSLLYCLAFLLVVRFQNIPALLIAIMVLGLSDSFGLPLQTGYYTDLKEVEQYGYDRAIGVYSLFENGSQAAGSFIFSYVLLMGVQQGLYLVIGILLTLAVIFLIINGIRPRKRSGNP